MAANQPLAFGAIFGGALLLIAGLTDSSLASVAQGKPDHAHKGGGSAPGEAFATSESPGGSIGGGRPPAGAAPDPRTLSLGGAASQTKQLKQAYVRVFSRRVGWSAADWEGVIERESGWNENATNPSSGAYGIGQFLGSTKAAYAHLGATSPDWRKQLNAMAAYIADRYGNPTNALAHERRFGWY